MWFLYKYVLLFLLSFVYITKYSDEIEEERALASDQCPHHLKKIEDKCQFWINVLYGSSIITAQDNVSAIAVLIILMAQKVHILMELSAVDKRHSLLIIIT